MRTDTILDLAQTIVASLALFAAVYAIVLQRREMAVSSKLNAAATLLSYYNAKISSLRDSIIRDSNNRERAQLQSLEEREARLKELLNAHEKILKELEQLYDRVA